MPTIAVLSAYYEIVQLCLIQLIFSPYLNIKKWLKDIETIPAIKKAYIKWQGYQIFNFNSINYIKKSLYF